MSLIVNGTEITDLFVIDRQGNRVEIEKLQDQLGTVIWELKKEINEVIIGFSLIKTGDYNTIYLCVFKYDENPNTIDWGDGTVETLNPTTVLNENGYIIHTYSQIGDYEIKISGTGIINLGSFYASPNTSVYRKGIITVSNSSGSAVSNDDAYLSVKYYKIGNICSQVTCPFGTAATTPVFPNISHQDVCYRYNNTQPYGFIGGTNIHNCYYNPNLVFKDMRGQANKILYNNPNVSLDYICGFEYGNSLILTDVGDATDLAKLQDYPFTELGYLNVPVGADVSFPSSINVFLGASLNINGNATLRFLVPNGINVSLPSSQLRPNTKTAYSITIYTDNETIKNYDWSGEENLTVTFYHLNGSAW